MALTLEKLMEVGRHALEGGDPAAVFGTDAGDTLREYINQAGEHLFTCRSWNWSSRRSVTLDLTASQNYVDLPVDFLQIESLESSSSAGGITLTTRDDLNKHRTATLGAIIGYLAAVAHPGQSTAADAQGRPVLEVYPEPSETLSDALTVFYKAKWVTLTGEDDAANIRQEYNALLCEFVRAFVRGAEDGDIGGRVAQVEAGPIFAAAVRTDGMQQNSFGPISGGAAAMQMDQAAFRTSVVPNPS